MNIPVQFSENSMTFPVKMSDTDQFVNAGMGEFQVVHDGKNGATFYPHVSEDGVLSWTNDMELDNPAPVDISGKKGDKGDPFVYEDFTEEQLKALKGSKGEPFTYGDFTEEQLADLTGPKGDPFEYEDFTPDQLAALKGKNGVSATHSWNGTVLTVTSASGTSSADLKGKDGYTPVKGVDYRDGIDGKDGYTPTKGIDYFDGNPGKDGADGQDGISPTVTVTDISGGHRVTITDKDGAKAFDVMDGKDGQGGGGGTSIQADMAQNDPTQADYVKNRTHWSEGVKVIPIQGMWVNSEAFGGYVFAFSAPLGLELGKSYVVTWDGTEYEGIAHEGKYNGIPCVCLGNTPLFFGTGYNGQPFALAEFPAEYVASAGAYGLAGATDFTINHEFSIKQETVHKLDNKFIDAEWMAKSTEETVLLPMTTLTWTGGVTGFSDPATGVVTNYYNLTSFDALNITIDKVPAASDMYILADGRKYYGTFYSESTDEDVTGIVYMFDTHLGVLVAHWLVFSATILCAILAKEKGSYTVAVGVGGRAVPLPEKYIPDNLKALIGTTDEITPAQVAEAVEAGRPIALAHTDATFGNLVFTAFAYAKTLGVVQASGVFYAYDSYVAAVLGGGVAGGGWNVSIDPLALASSVPTVDDIIDALPIYNGEVIAE